MTSFAPKDLISKTEVLRYLGYRGQTIDEKLTARIDEVMMQCERELNPKGVYAIFAIKQVKKGDKPQVILDGTDLVLEGSSIQNYLEKAAQVALMACTLGAQSEQELRRLSATDPTTALIYDASCSVLIESGMNTLQKKVAQDAEDRGYALTERRYSPGYGDFPLAVQPTFLQTIKATQRLGLTATPDNLLLPSKSITAVVGLHP